MRQDVEIPMVHLCVVFLLGIILGAQAEQSDETCDAKTGKCAGLEYAFDPPCYFPTTFHDVRVKDVRQETHNSKIISFELPEGMSLNLPVSSAILMNAPGYGKDGKDVFKPYNPVSSNSDLGSFDLLVKSYEKGVVSKYADTLKLGDRVAFKQIKPNIKKWIYPFNKKSITMLAGGTGVAPMIQALYPLLTTPGDTTEIRLLYGNDSPKDIMLKSVIDAFAAKYADRFQVTYIVGKTADDTSAKQNDGWTGETGWIDEDKVRRLAFPPGEGTAVWVCGLDEMYNSLAGSRAAKLKPDSALVKLGYTEDMVWRS